MLLPPLRRRLPVLRQLVRESELVPQLELARAPEAVAC